MHYQYLGRRYARDSRVYTPGWLAEFLYSILPKTGVVLDPCVGAGDLIRPWNDSAITVGIDIENHNPPVDHFQRYPFNLLSSWSLPKPDLVVCNSPFGGVASNSGSMWPEVFLRQIDTLFGKVPTALFAPHGFRLNQSMTSKRRKWMISKSSPQISSVVSLPVDTFPGIKFHCEILLFNMPNVKPHYWAEPAEVLV